jgi:peptide/nickel transport system substrate-binding protein
MRLNGPRHRRRLLLTGALVSAVTLLTACSSSSGSAASSGAPTGSSSGSGGTGLSDQTLRIAEGAEQPTLDPATDIQYLSDELGAVYETLVVTLPDGSTGPGLAESWTVDGPSITFKLRQGVKFHDGTPFNAAAVKAEMDRIQDPNTKATNSKSILGPFKSATVVDDNTVTITWSTPFSGALLALSNADLSIASPTAAAAGGLATHPVGTGPYKFVEYVKGDHLTVERNDAYTTIRTDLNNHGAPKYKTIVFSYITNSSTRANLLTTGGADLGQLVGPDAKRLDATGTLNKNSFPSISQMFIAVNVGKISDINVRQAISAALDREAIITAIAAGYGDVNYSVLPTIIPGYDKSVESIVPHYDVGAAEKFLTDAGYTKGSDGVMAKDGQPLEFELLSQAEDPFPAMAQLVQDQLSQVGIKTTIKSQELATVQTTRRTGEQGIYVGRYGILDPAGNLTVLFACKNIPSKDNPLGTNLTFNCNKDIDAALAGATTSVDAKTRDGYLATAQQLIAKDNTALVLYQAQNVVFSAKSVTGVGMQPDGILKINDLAPAS